MSNNPNLMDTEPGGEQTQYEGEHTDMQPHAKLGGQFGGPSSTTSTTHKSANDTPNTQNIKQGGMGGQTTSSTGEADAGGDTEEAGKARRVEGYGGERDMDRNVGA